MLFLNKKKGFTVVELLIVSAILALIASVIVVRFSSFNGRILTTNLAYDIALSIREAQAFGINVQGFDTGSSVTFDTSYGIHFDDASNNSYLLFADLNDNDRYAPNELIESFTMGGGHVISNFCGTNVSGESCSSLGEISDLDIIFKRPDPDANIFSHSPTVTYQSASITITSPQGVEREINVFSTGQISIVQNP